MILPHPDELQKAWLELKDIHREYLAVHNVKLPSANYYADTNKSLWLAVLYFYKDKDVHKDKISEIARRDKPASGADQQVRHLKRDGWEIGEKPGVHRLDPYKPASTFINVAARKSARLHATNFAEIKKAYGGRCATCGAREGQPDPRYGGEKVSLQQAHQDPHKPGDDRKNIIPQCQFCNQAYLNDFVFDDKGRAHAVASERPVKRANKNVQRKIFNWLVEKFNK